MLSKDKIKEVIDLGIRTHIGVGVAIAVCAGITGYVYSSGCGPVMTSENFGEAVDWDIESAHDMPGEAHADEAHADQAHADEAAH